MSGRQKTYRVELTETESRQLQELVAARKSSRVGRAEDSVRPHSSQSEARRAKIVLTSVQHPDWTDAKSESSHWLFPSFGAKMAQTLVSNPQPERGSS